MRSVKLVPAIAAAISLLMLMPAGALARKHPSPNGRCRISIDVAPREITAGDPVVIFGRLTCREGAVQAGQTVLLYHHLLRRGFGFTYVQSTTTDAHGFYEFARADGVVESNRAWYVRSHGASSARKAIKVAARVTLSGPAEGAQLLTGPANKVTFSGAVSPVDVGARVILQRQNAATGGEWRRIDSGRVEAGGGFSILHRFLVPGDASIRVLIRSQGRNIPSESNVLTYEISQAQNPALTIAASADPILFGQSVTISGSLASTMADQGPVVLTLLARTVHQPGFVPVAQTLLGANGAYSFAPQSPPNSTFYQVVLADPSCRTAPPNVRACRAKQLQSAVLYEGVKDVLTAQVSATTVQAGQQLTFSGSVAPNHAGHIIYLERQDASGQGFHVVELGVVNPDSTYSIAHTVYDAGAKVFRVYIPGGPENEGAASQPFTIQVTAPPLASLMPEAPGNTSQPSEGQS
jgi:hypothetical protein